MKRLFGRFNILVNLRGIYMCVDQYFMYEREGRIMIFKVRAGNIFRWCCDGSDLLTVWLTCSRT